MTRFTRLFVLLSFTLCSAINLLSQATASGVIEGTVLDNSQAVIVGAEISAVNKGTGARRTATTSANGTFRFDLMPAGNYTVQISKKGFASSSRDVELLVGRTASIDATLSPGSTNEIIEVQAAAPLLDVEKTSVSQQITPKEVEELPLVGRDAANLAYLAPGVKALNAPFSHLCFALCCGAQILEHSCEYAADSIEQAATFLREYLTFLPLPECYLVCLLLMQEKQPEPDMLAHLHVLSTLQALLDTPIALLRPEEALSDNKVEAFKKELVRLKLMDLWRLWIHDYAQRHPFTAKAWPCISEKCW